MLAAVVEGKQSCDMDGFMSWVYEEAGEGIDLTAASMATGLRGGGSMARQASRSW